MDSFLNKVLLYLIRYSLSTIFLEKWSDPVVYILQDQVVYSQGADSGVS